MNKKIVIVSLLSVFMLVAIAFASTVTSNTPIPPKKESPLFRIRVRQAIREKIGDLMRRFVGERVFFLPFQWLRDIIKNKENLYVSNKCGTYQYTNCYESTCKETLCVFCTDAVHCTEANT